MLFTFSLFYVVHDYIITYARQITSELLLVHTGSFKQFIYQALQIKLAKVTDICNIEARLVRQLEIVT